jgi:hypothetical protein
VSLLAGRWAARRAAGSCGCEPSGRSQTKGAPRSWSPWPRRRRTALACSLAPAKRSHLQLSRLVTTLTALLATENRSRKWASLPPSLMTLPLLTPVTCRLAVWPWCDFFISESNYMASILRRTLRVRKCFLSKYGLITNDVSYYMNLLVRIAHIICNHPLLQSSGCYLLALNFPLPAAQNKILWDLILRRRCSSVSIVTLLRAGRLGFDSRQG